MYDFGRAFEAAFITLGVICFIAGAVVWVVGSWIVRHLSFAWN